MMTLLSFLEAAGVKVNRNNYKVHLATPGPYTSPMTAFFAGKFQEWQERQSKRNFACEHIVSLINFGPNLWLFAGVYRVLGEPVFRDESYFYSTELLESQDSLIGRVVVEHARSGRASYVWGSSDGIEVVLHEVLPRKHAVADYPGHHAVRIDHATLRLIVQEQVSSWKHALAEMKGVYLISDVQTGKLYVGSAYGDQGIWQRWNAYAVNGHGGNAELVSILKKDGEGYLANFRYSILEIADSYATDEYIIARENYWKEALLSREPFGYNKN